MNTPLGPQTVGQVVAGIKDVLESTFRQIWVVGEISNLSLSSSGHWYFTLSDKDSGLGCALFKVDAFRNPEMKKLKDGDKVECFGPINVYPRRGTFQLIVKRIRAVGKGDLKEQFEALKRQLAAEGLFDLEAKKDIPKLPQRVAIITAERSAALADFLNIYERRSVWMNVTVIPALVQGEAAPASLRQALHRALEYSIKTNPANGYDVIVLARGGGSLEDLWAFNDEGLAYDIFNSPIPIISAVGHQVDYSLSDYVADLRCETPSAAAEMLTSDQVELLKRVSYCARHLIDDMEKRVLKLRSRLQTLGPHAFLERIRTRLLRLERTLDGLRLQERASELVGLIEINLRLEDSLDVLARHPSEALKELGVRLDHQMSVLRALDPKGVLDRGYSYVTDKEGKVVTTGKSFDLLENGAKLDLHFKDGKRQVVRP